MTTITFRKRELDVLIHALDCAIHWQEDLKRCHTPASWQHDNGTARAHRKASDGTIQRIQALKLKLGGRERRGR